MRKRTAFLETFNTTVVKRWRKDYLTLMKNIPRVKNYNEARELDKAVSRWSEKLDKYIYTYLLDKWRDLKYSGEISDGVYEYWDKTVREKTWPFVIGVNLPLRRSDEYISKERSYLYFQRDVKRWENSIRRKSRVAWNVLIEFAEEFESIKGKGNVRVNVPREETIEVHGFTVVLRGHDNLSDYGKKKFKGQMSVLYEGLKYYKARAKKVLPLLLAKKLPLILDFKLKLDDGGEYKNDHIRINASMAEKPSYFAYVVAHEMGHHIYDLIGREAESYWYKVINGAKTTIDLRKVLDKYSQQKTWWNNRVIKKENPLLYLQLQGLIYGYGRSSFEKYIGTKELSEAIASGEVNPIVSVSSKPISGYANKNENEAFCEVIGQLVAYGPRTVPEEMRYAMKKILPSIKMAKKLLVLAKCMVASTWSDWKKFIDFVEKEFPNSKIKVMEKRTGQSIWEYGLDIDGIGVFKLEEIGRDERKKYSFKQLSGGFYQKSISGEKEITFSDFKNEYKSWKKNNADLVERFSGSAIDVEKGKELEKAVEDAIKVVIKMIKGYDVVEVYFGQQGDKTIKARPLVVLRSNAHQSFLELNYDVKAGVFKIWVRGFGYKEFIKSDNVDDYIKELKKIDKTFMSGIKRVSDFERGVILGKYKPEDVVEKIKNIKVDYGVEDEWLITEISFKLILREEHVGDELVRKWIGKNWDKIVEKIKSKPPKSPGSRGIERDESLRDTGFISPKNTVFDNADEVKIGHKSENEVNVWLIFSKR